MTATAINKRFVFFKCPLNSRLCTNHHVVAVPECKHGSDAGKAVYIIDTKVIIGCLQRALQRCAWDELSSFVSANTLRGLRIIVTSDTIVDHEDDPNPMPRANIDQQLKMLAGLKDKDLLTVKTNASVRHEVERRRSKAMFEAHIALAVTSHMFHYQKSLNRNDPYAQTNGQL